MAIRVVVGAQWGDEGKGKVVDLLSKDADFVVRYQGGANAGHTLKFDDQEIVLHLVPSGIFNGSAKCVIGNGVVIEPRALLEEINNIRERGIELENRLFISSSAHAILPYHKLLDQVKEKHRGEDAIGTTGRGIGPAYVSKVSRVGIRMADLFHPDILEEKIRTNLDDINEALTHIYKEEPLQVEEILEDTMEAADELCPYITNTASLLHRGIESGKHILLEGAQGSLLDIDHGTYPYVTSSSPTAGGACTGTGISPRAIDHVMGITKAYCTRVGNGPFPTELTGEIGEFLRKEGREFGATTGRPRRCGWIDLVALRYAVHVNGIDELAITKIDILNNFEQINACTAYRVEGQLTEEFSPDLYEIQHAEPVYKTFDGWQSNLSDCSSFSDLPKQASEYIRFIEQYLGVDVTILSSGPKRSETILID
ncbi:MAG: adenylosuccinate synthase [Balneolaceae bacterium]|nr:adenylosuccinate synthase [Balneolaceae bacterium]